MGGVKNKLIAVLAEYTSTYRNPNISISRH